MKKIVISGGHLSPALSLIDKLNGQKDLEIIYFGRKLSTEGTKNYSAEYLVIKEKGIKFIAITAGRLQRKFTRYTFYSLLKFPIGFLQTFFHLLTIRPALIVSFGGYLSTPVVFCGWLLGIGSVTHEQAVIPGLATKINSLFVKRIFLSWQESKKYFPDSKSEVIGNLVRSSIYKTKAKSKIISNFLAKSKNLIYITGGNQGSHIINKVILGALDKLKDFDIIHQVGTVNFKGDFDKAKKVKQSNYLAVDFIKDEDIGAVLNKASIIISRSGANTVWEIMLLAKPAILVPLPIAAADEQYAHAKVLADIGAAIIIKQDKLDQARLIKEIRNISKNYQLYKKAFKDVRGLLLKNAPEKLARFIYNYLDY